MQSHEIEILHLTGSQVGILALAVFGIAYLLVAIEELTGLKKSKPVIFAATLIWGMIAWEVHRQPGLPNNLAEEAFSAAFIEFAELFVFLLVAMTYINAMTEKHVFEALRSWLVQRRMSYRAIFWVTGFLAFFISPIADNLTTALLMGAVVMAVGKDYTSFIVLGCINIVIGANAGGAFSPFGDITTLMVWQRGMVEFWDFFRLFLPALISFVIPAAIMSFFVPSGVPEAESEPQRIGFGGRRIILLFLLTIGLTAYAHQAYDMPAVYGMMGGLSLLQLFGFYLHKVEHRRAENGDVGDVVPFDVFRSVARAEWDTLLFFYGVLLCVAGIAEFGYLELLSSTLYGTGMTTAANVGLGLISAVVDNIPVMLAALTMNPQMDLSQWLLLTFTVGVGGSLLSVGSAAGVGLMGVAHGQYTFLSHLKWTWVVLLGTGAGVIVHLLLNGGL